ncbi:MAG: PTS transporter subunit EIIC [Culicoidibacterales bacterium]
MQNNSIFGVLQRVGRSFMLPIAILPVAGLFLGVGGSFTNTTLIEAYGWTAVLGPGTVLNTILTIVSSAGDVIFGNLPLIFAIAIALGMAKAEKATAALSGAIAFLVMQATISATLLTTGQIAVVDGAIVTDLAAGATKMVLGLPSLELGVFGGMIIGIMVSILHNKFYKIELPSALSFFGGTRFIPIVSAVFAVLVGLVMTFVWPYIFGGITAIGNFVEISGYFGTFVYGFIERALIPFGLHHVFYLPFWQTAVGGSMEVAGTVVYGAQNIFFAQLADPTTTQFAASATRFMAGKFPFMMFGLPAAAYAMYTTARPENKSVVKGLLISAALTSFLTGITEPLEFTFLFLAPGLYYGVHSVLAGLSFMLMHILNVGVGMTFSGGLLDFVLYGVLPGPSATNYYWILVVGAAYAVVYFFLFRFFILKFDLKTPGREEAGEEAKLYTRADVNAAKGGATTTTTAKAGAGDELSATIVAGLGGKDNISDLDSCATRLRVTVKDPAKVDDKMLKGTGAAGLVKSGNGVQVIYGPRVSVIKSNIEEYLEA